MKDVGITHVVNMTKEVPNYFEKSDEIDLQYLKNPIEDETQSNILSYF